jgi:cell division protein FtsQ
MSLQPPKGRPNLVTSASKKKVMRRNSKVRPLGFITGNKEKNSFAPTRWTSPKRREQLKETRRFTKESQVKKIFLRSTLAALTGLVLFVLATMFTPIMAISKITVTGTVKISEKQVQAALKKHLGSPLPMISGSAIAEDLAKFNLIETISLVSNPPHELQVRIVERTPIAIVVNAGVAYLYDPSGVRVGSSNGSEKLPTIIIKGDPKTSKNYAQAIDVLLSLPSSLLERVAYIQARTRDNVSIQLRGNSKQSIVWGDSSQAVLKSRVLKVLLSKTPKTVSATFDVSSPTTPSVIR